MFKVLKQPLLSPSRASNRRRKASNYIKKKRMGLIAIITIYSTLSAFTLFPQKTGIARRSTRTSFVIECAGMPELHRDSLKILHN